MGIRKRQTEMSPISLKTPTQMFFMSFTTTESYFPLYFSSLEIAILKEQVSVAASDLHRFWKSHLFMTFSGYPIEPNLLFQLVILSSYFNPITCFLFNW